jgi:hypothetical protein
MGVILPMDAGARFPFEDRPPVAQTPSVSEHETSFAPYHSQDATNSYDTHFLRQLNSGLANVAVTPTSQDGHDYAGFIAYAFGQENLVRELGFRAPTQADVLVALREARPFATPSTYPIDPDRLIFGARCVTTVAFGFILWHFLIPMLHVVR